MIKTKTSSFLTLLSSLLIMSMAFLGCTDDGREDSAPVGGKTIHVELTANVVTSLPVVNNSTKGFNLDVTHSAAGSMATPINWNSDNWNNVDNKPVVLSVVRNKSDKSLVPSGLRKLDYSEYEYESGHGSFSSKIHISANLVYTGTDNEVVFYLLDKKDLSERYNTTEKTLTFNGGASLYDVSGKNPIFLKDIAENVFVEPNPRIFFNFIFSGAIDLSNYNGATSVSTEFDMRPLGTLLMTDFSPRTMGDELNNPAYIEGFHPTLNTNAFDLNTEIDLVKATNVKNSSSDDYIQQVGFEVYEDSGNSVTPIISTASNIHKIGGNSNSLSGVYVKYVLGRSRDGFSVSLSNNNVTIFKNNNAGNFAQQYESKRVGLNFLMTSEAVKATIYDHDPVFGNNALWYLAEAKVNKAKDGFDTKYSSLDNSLATFSEAKEMFGKNNFLKDYHLPSRYEWQSIIPYFSSDPRYLYFQNAQGVSVDSRTEEETNVEIGKALLKDTKSYYETVSETEGNVTYAIRFAEGTLVRDNSGQEVNTPLSVGNNPYISVWRYSCIQNGLTKMYSIYCKVLPTNTTIEYGSTLKINTGKGMVDFKRKDFFAEADGSPAEGVVHRKITLNGADYIGSYWSSTSLGSKAFTAFLTKDYGFIQNTTNITYEQSVHPFKGATKVITPTPPAIAPVEGNNPLFYVAEHNVNKAKTGFAQKNTNEDAALVKWTEAKGLFTNPANKFLNGYHLPNRYEWQSIWTSYSNFQDKKHFVYFANSRDVVGDTRIGEYTKVQIGKAVLENTTSYYQTIREGYDNVCYAIRFVEGKLVKDSNGQDVNTPLKSGNNPYMSVWRYSYVDNPNGGGGKMLAVYCKVLPANAIVQKHSTLIINTGNGMEDFKNKDFFAYSDNSPKPGVIYREFPTSGIYYEIIRENSSLGNEFSYWSSSSYMSSSHAELVWYSYYYDESQNCGVASSDEGAMGGRYMAVRPFKGATETTPPVVNPVPENNALLYVAERSVNEDKTGWSDGSNTDCALVNWENAKGLFTDGSHPFLNNYHLPSRYEWQSIIPSSISYSTSTDYVYFSSTQGVREDRRGGEKCKVEIGKALIENAKSYYETVSETEGNVTYAVRFYEGTLVKDNEGRDANNKSLTEGNNPYISVWRYSYVNNPNGGGGKMMAVYCKVLPANTTFNKKTLELTIKGKTESFKNKNFFAESNGTPKTDVVYREFPTSGYGFSPRNVGSDGDCWSSSPGDSGYAYTMDFNSGYATLTYYGILGQFAVRPFAGKK